MMKDESKAAYITVIASSQTDRPFVNIGRSFLLPHLCIHPTRYLARSGGGWCRSGQAGRTVGQVGSSANVESSPLSGRLAVVMFFHQYLSIFVQPWHARTSPSLHAMPRPSSRKRCEWHVSGMLSRHESNAKKNTFFIRTEAYNLHMQVLCPFGCESFTGIW